MTVKTDSVVKTLVILFLVAISPFVLALMMLVVYLWAAVVLGASG